jgi:16S rRNA (cytosine1402-N4)-methyltransferase
MSHIPVLLEEIKTALELKAGDVYVDGTLGLAGHAKAMYLAADKKATIIGFDKDGDSLKKAKVALEEIGAQPILFKTSFASMKKCLVLEQVASVHAILLDLGVSSPQLDTSGRGFSFRFDEPLLMTMNESVDEHTLTAKDLLSSLSTEQIETIIKNYGEERYAKSIARAIVAHRELEPIETTFQLVDIIKGAVPSIYRHGKIHPATKTFQALRIAVNDELGDLEKGLEAAFDLLAPEGKLAVITFHSLEDRIVKHFMKDKVLASKGVLYSKKPIVPTEVEIKNNPRSRSAKLRVIIKK